MVPPRPASPTRATRPCESVGTRISLIVDRAAAFPALAAAASAGAFAAVADPLAFGLDRVLDGIQLLVERPRQR
jgi:hypothetical protein